MRKTLPVSYTHLDVYKRQAIDGVDASGKQTQSELLYKRLTDSGICARLVSFPDYGSESSALVRMYLNGDFGSRPEDVNAYAASTFFAADRFASYRRCV